MQPAFCISAFESGSPICSLKAWFVKTLPHIVPRVGAEDVDGEGMGVNGGCWGCLGSGRGAVVSRQESAHLFGGRHTTFDLIHNFTISLLCGMNKYQQHQ